MKIGQRQIHDYQEQGFLLLERRFSPVEIERVRAQLPRALAEESPRRVLERDGKTVRGIHGQHLDYEIFSRLVRHPRLVEPARQLLDEDVHVYQFKINFKSSLTGDAWPWHQDYIFWEREDGLERADLVTALVMLDDATEFNGPLMFLEGSHREGCIAVEPSEASIDEARTWVNNLTVDLKYALPHEQVRSLCARYPLTSVKAPAGSVLLFHPNVVHGSANNMSAHDRCFALITYCSMSNRLRPVSCPRPAFLTNRTPTPVELAPDSILIDDVPE